ncbi:MAG: hypothetical protein RSC09_00790 [Clostridia bacterium]
MIIIVVLILSISLISLYNTLSIKKQFYSDQKTNKFYKSKFLKKLNVGLGLCSITKKISLKTYVTFKVFLSIIFSLIFYINSQSLAQTFCYWALIFFIIDIYLIVRVKDENNNIVNTIYNISEIFYQLLEAEVPYKDVLEIVIDVIDNKKFKYEFTEFVFKYKRQGYNLELASKSILSIYDSDELNRFIETLKCSFTEETLKENLKDFLSQLAYRKMNYFKSMIAKKRVTVMISILMILVSIMSIITYPIIIELTNSISTIFC